MRSGHSDNLKDDIGFVWVSQYSFVTFRAIEKTHRLAYFGLSTVRAPSK